MKKREISAQNSRILSLAGDVTKAIVAEAEEILEDAEKVVKEFVPARFVSKALAAIEEKLEEEGIEAAFDKGVSREALKVTASDEATEEEINEVVDEIVAAIVEELEETLEDADSVMDEEKVAFVEGDEEDQKLDVEAKLKTIVERKLHAKGIYVRFARTAKKEKLTIAQKIREASKK